ncbi:MAG: Holliday junction resolvase RuvX [Candidatus Cloacimonetes bacterium]|nr:Holliday junction resolvase RuvX [Candidatus Cloacimonadota bacterium]NLO44512.1 Holliday junction resolvase RuvX [Candidatus Cloacimonadota bacterium]
MSGRILAIDYGHKRIGIALSDPLRIFAKPFKTLENQGMDTFLSEIKQICEAERVTKIIFGMPYAIAGHDTPKTLETRKAMEFIQNGQALPVIPWDERYSSADAEEELKKMGKSWQEARKLVDAMAAALILRNYLQSEDAE